MIVGLDIVSIFSFASGIGRSAYGGENMVMGYAMAESGCDTGDSRSFAVEAVVVGNSLAGDIDDCLVSAVRTE